MNRKRKIADFFKIFATCISTLLSVIILFSIIFYVFKNGFSSLSFKFLTSNYNDSLNIVATSQTEEEFSNPNIEGTYFSYKYGIALKDSKTVDNKECVEVVYVATLSPFNNLNIVGSNDTHKVVKGETIDVLIGIDKDKNDIYCFSSQKAEEFCKGLDKSYEITYLQCALKGGGITCSLLATIYLIILTLLFSLPLGIIAAIYLTLYAKNKTFKTIVINMIDATSGVPSIIFGFVGMIVFIPFVSIFTKKDSLSIIAGALTMSIILLPLIIKTTSEAINVVPNSYLEASLALGASKTQSVFKVILPSAMPGILTATLLSIGRIIGESASLIFVMGNSIKDNVSLASNATTLATHIYAITSGETLEYNSACAISIIILIVVFIMNLLVKLISYKINKKRGV